MHFPIIIALLAATTLAENVQFVVTRDVECTRKSQKGDTISVHYRGSLTDGTQFDASYDRGNPLSFVVGKVVNVTGNANISGRWDDNLVDMCIGEKRTLTIPPEFGYGDRNVGPIPAKSTLIFETELIAIEGVPTPESIVEKEPKPATTSTAGIKEAIMSKLVDVADAVEVVLSDTDGDEQEHNEL